MMKTRSKAKAHTRKNKGFIASEKPEENFGRQSSLTAEQASESSLFGERAIGKLPDTVEEFDQRFDAGEDLHDLGIDLSKATRPGLETKRVNIDLPAHFLDKLDHCAAIRGLTRQALIKSWLYDRLEEVALAAAQRASATLERKRIQPKKSVERPHILPRA
jgi:predicted DNA binding CopG/RHH family protein